MACGCHLYTFFCNQIKSIENVVSVIALAEFDWAHINKELK
jgi:hypothetical protein